MNKKENIEERKWRLGRRRIRKKIKIKKEMIEMKKMAKNEKKGISARGMKKR